MSERKLSRNTYPAALRHHPVSRNRPLALQLILGAVLVLVTQVSVLNLTPAAFAQGIDGRAYGLDAVIPAQFNGDVRNLTPVPSQPLDKPLWKAAPIVKQPSAQPQAPQANNSPSAAMPAPIRNFAGLARNTAVTGGPAGAGTPPDTNGDVGLNHYIQAVNDAYGIYNKTGTLLAAFTENSLFSSGTRPGGLTGTGTLCDTNSFGDPVVVYDEISDHWFLTNFAFVLSGGGNQLPPTYQCFAVSKTGDPVGGGWWLYAVRIDTNAVGQPPTGTLGDYPKFGNWNDDCLYMAANGFNTSGTFVGTVFASFNKSAMRTGTMLSGSNSALGFIANSSTPFTMVPSNISGARGSVNLPPALTPNYFVSESTSANAFEVRKFTPGAGCGAGGTLASPTNVSQTNYNGFGGSNVPQPNVATTLDWIDDRIMQKVQYRRMGAAESLWVVHNVEPTNGSTTVRPQWAQINVTGGTVAVNPLQQQIYAPDTTLWRWMGSIAADHNGNVALGYSTSNGTSPNFPSIAYSGRLLADPANTLPQSEVQLIAGGGSQNFVCGSGPCNRWGDYSAMSVDPSDDCTFWYTNEYYDTQANGNAGIWQTRIGSFKFPTCSAPTAVTLDTFSASSSSPLAPTFVALRALVVLGVGMGVLLIRTRVVR